MGVGGEVIMIEIVIGVILIIIALLIVGLIYRKKVYDNVDRLEAWKMDIMNRDVTTELARIKKLNLSGETQEKFESWKENWDMILTQDLPDMEEYLLDAEEAADKFFIKNAKKNLNTVEESLQNIEKSIEDMYEELDHLLNSEKYVRQQIEELAPQLQKLKKYILHNRTQFGRAEMVFEAELSDLEKHLTEYKQLSEEGNYIEAQQLIEQLKEQIQTIEEKINVFPALYRQTKLEVPSQMKELLRGMEEMKEEGYRVQQFGFEKELKQYEHLLKNALNELENGEVAAIQESLEQMEDRLEEMYQLLEKEAKSKTMVESLIPKQKQAISELAEKAAEIANELHELKQTYYLEEANLELFLSMEKWLEKLKTHFEQTVAEYEEKTANHIEIKDKLDHFAEEIAKIEAAQDDFHAEIKDFRKDELAAKEEIKTLKIKLIQTRKVLEKSNIPGVPSYIMNALEEATDKSEVVLKKLQKKPLDMGKVQHAISEADKSVSSFVEQTHLLLDQARLVELAIQFGNRYRSSSPLLAEQLSEAEKLFRQCKYESALEKAITSLEEIEPNAMKRIEELDQEFQRAVN